MHTPSKQKWLERNRPPRVQISYDVETAGAIEKRELPLVVGVLADLSGPQGSAVPVGERRFVEIDRDTFNTVLAKIEPRLTIADLKLDTVPGLDLSGEIRFSSIDDFEPEHIVKSVPGLSELFDARNELRDLMAKLDGNAKLEGRLSAIFVDAEGKDTDSGARDAQLKLLTGDAGAAAAPAPAPATDPGAAEEPAAGDDNKPA